MRLEDAQDPRRILCEKKYFGLRPEPLEQYLYSLRLSQTAERVFWLHWDLGLRSGAFVSELSLREVARRCHCTESSVTRAYQVLKARGLLRRQDPGRDPRRPFQQAIALTEVLLPAAALGRLLGAPNRGGHTARNPGEQPEMAASSRETAIPRESGQRPSSSPANATTGTECSTQGAVPQPTRDTQTVLEAAESLPTDPATYWLQCLERLRTTVPESDFTTWLRPLQPYAVERQLILFAPNSFAIERLKGGLAAQIRTLLKELAPTLQGVEIRVGNRPTPTTPPTSPGFKSRLGISPYVRQPSKPRLNEFLLAQLRQRLSKLSLGEELEQRFCEAAWSIEYGALTKVVDRVKAINAAVKLIREGEWTRPNRMPPNWRLCLATTHETCVAA